MDRDDNGQVALDFTTRQTGAAASAAFVHYPACRPSTEPDAVSDDVSCRVEKLDVAIYLDDKGALGTEGELTWTPT